MQKQIESRRVDKAVVSKAECVTKKGAVKENDTLKGSRTPAACLEGKHDNRFTISVPEKGARQIDDNRFSSCESR